MPLGGLAPFPMRLGPSSETAVSPEEWLRLAVDAAAIDTPICILRIIVLSGAGSGIITGFGRGTFTPTLSVSWAGAIGTFVVTPGDAYTDDLGNSRNWTARAAIVNMLNGVPDALSWEVSSGQLEITVDASGAYTNVFHIAVYGETEPRFAGDYGSEPNKVESPEGVAPYAWIWLQETQRIRGDAFSIAAGSFTQMENISMARFWGLVQRVNERHAAQQIPEYSDQALPRWIQLLGLGSTNQRDWELRRKAGAMFSLTMSGPTADALNDALSAVFGPNFVQVHRFEGTLDAPPAGTYWPAGDPGPGPLIINREFGNWTSTRYHFLIELTATSDADRVRVLNIAARDMDEILTAALPPVCTWAYNFNGLDGFVLGTSELGRDSL